VTTCLCFHKPPPTHVTTFPQKRQRELRPETTSHFRAVRTQAEARSRHRNAAHSVFQSVPLVSNRQKSVGGRPGSDGRGLWERLHSEARRLCPRTGRDFQCPYTQNDVNGAAPGIAPGPLGLATGLNRSTIY